MKSVIPITWEVPEEFRRRLGEGAGRQRAMSADGNLLLVLHHPPQPGATARSGRLFWRDRDGTWKSTDLGAGVGALRKHLAEFAETVEALERRWHEADSAEDYYRLLLAVAPAHRTARNLHAAFQQARELLPEDREILDLRDQAGALERATELLHADAKNGLDFMVAYQSEEQTRRCYEMAVAAHRLNLLAAVFFPLATLAAVFGMSLTHWIDETAYSEFFWPVLALGIALGAILALLVARKPAPLRPPPTPRRKPQGR